MIRLRVGRTPVWIVAVGLLASGLSNTDESERKPNIVLILTDDHGYADLSCQGVVSDVRTPNIDALASAGVRMTAGYVTAPQCAPTRAALLVGRYQNRFGIESNQSKTEGFERQVTVVERLRESGYATGLVGKWHLGRPGKIRERGFDDFLMYPGTTANFDLGGKDTGGSYEPPRKFHVDNMTAGARAFIGRHHDEPFFLLLSYQAPHVPLNAPSRYFARFPGVDSWRRRQALAMLSAVDDGVGRVMDSLQDYGVRENTAIFFVSDHGAPLLMHKSDEGRKDKGWNGSLNDPFSGEKGMLSEGGVRVPFIVSWSGGLAGGRVFESPVSSLDIAATSLALAGLEPDARADGVDLLPFLRDKERGDPHSILFWRFGVQAAVREGDWKYIRAGEREYLFDLAEDETESENRAAAEPELAAALAGKLEAWASELTPAGLEAKKLPPKLATLYDFYHEGDRAAEDATGD